MLKITSLFAAVALLCIGAIAQQSPGAQPGIPRLAIVSAAGNPPEQCVDKIRTAAREFAQAKNDQAIPSLDKLLTLSSSQLCSTYLILSSTPYQAASRAARGQLLSINEANIALFKDFTREVKALGQQEGSSSGTGGSTNLVSKGVAAKFISIASEYGALTQSTSNNSTTIQGHWLGSQWY